MELAFSMLLKNETEEIVFFGKSLKREIYRYRSLKSVKDRQVFIENIIKQIQFHDGIIFSDQITIAELLNEFFIKSVEDLKIEPFLETPINDGFTPINVTEIISNYEDHPSILKIKESFEINETFSFQQMSSVELKQKIRNLDAKKAIAPNDIPTKVLIFCDEIAGDYLSDIYNKSEKNKIFPESLKLANIIPVHKKENAIEMKTYRPMSLLPKVS